MVQSIDLRGSAANQWSPVDSISHLLLLHLLPLDAQYPAAGHQTTPLASYSVRSIYNVLPAVLVLI